MCLVAIKLHFPSFSYYNHAHKKYRQACSNYRPDIQFLESYSSGWKYVKKKKIKTPAFQFWIAILNARIKESFSEGSNFFLLQKDIKGHKLDRF